MSAGELAANWCGSRTEFPGVDARGLPFADFGVDPSGVG
jgi:hypothetical protein